MTSNPTADHDIDTIVFITLDAWRISHASFMPNTSDLYTPNMAAFGESSAVFTQAVSHGPATPYAFPAIFTSTLPLDHGGYEKLSNDRTHVAEALQQDGWTCTGAHANPWLGEDYGYGRGYSEYTDVGEFSLPGFDRARRFLISNFGLDHSLYKLAQKGYRTLSGPLRMLSNGGTGEISTMKDALDNERLDDHPQFLWTHLLDPHAPYTPAQRHQNAVDVPTFDGTANQLVTKAQQSPEELSGHERSVIKKLYAAAVRHADERVGELLEVIPDDALVVITADHGEALFEHGQLGHEPALYDELIHIPLLVRPPGGLPEKRVFDTQAQHIDIAPTILDYVDIPTPESYQGYSLRALIEEDKRDRFVDRVAVSEVSSTAAIPGNIEPDALQVAVRTPTQKVIQSSESIQRYDLQSDPDELHSETGQIGSNADRLEECLQERLEEIDFANNSAIERNKEVEERLRTLGYFE